MSWVTRLLPEASSNATFTKSTAGVLAHVLWVKPCAKRLMGTVSFSHNDIMHEVLLLDPFYGWQSWSVTDLPKGTQSKPLRQCGAPAGWLGCLLRCCPIPVMRGEGKVKVAATTVTQGGQAEGQGLWLTAAPLIQVLGKLQAPWWGDLSWTISVTDGAAEREPGVPHKPEDSYNLETSPHQKKTTQTLYHTARGQ